MICKKFIYLIYLFVTIGANTLFGQNKDYSFNNNSFQYSDSYKDSFKNYQYVIPEEAGIHSQCGFWNPTFVGITVIRTTQKYLSGNNLQKYEIDQDNLQNSLALLQDTLKRINLRDSTIKDTSQRFEMKKSTTKALVYSLLMPGLGQVYVESYWKAPLFFGGAATLAYFIFWNNSRYLSWAANADTISAISDPTGYKKLIAINNREYYRDNRDQSAFFLVAVYILAAVDAYTDAHLFDFDVSQKFSYNFGIDTYKGLFLNMSYRW